MKSTALAQAFLKGAGVLLVVLGAVHLAATSHLPDLLEGMSSQDAYERALGPTLLNHVLVGILLIAVGATTWLAAAASQVEPGWAQKALLINALTVLTLPVAIIVFMRQRVYYTSPWFLTGVSLVALISLLMVAAAVVLVRQPNRARP